MQLCLQLMLCIFSKYGCLSKNSDGCWIVVLLHGFDHANSCVQRCLYVLLSQGCRRRNSANPPTFRIFLYLSLQKLVLFNFLVFQYQTIQVPSRDDWLGLFYSNDMQVKSKQRTHQLTVPVKDTLLCLPDHLASIKTYTKNKKRKILIRVEFSLPVVLHKRSHFSFHPCLVHVSSFLSHFVIKYSCWNWQ